MNEKFCSCFSFHWAWRLNYIGASSMSMWGTQYTNRLWYRGRQTFSHGHHLNGCNRFAYTCIGHWVPDYKHVTANHTILQSVILASTHSVPILMVVWHHTDGIAGSWPCLALLRLECNLSKWGSSAILQPIFACIPIETVSVTSECPQDGGSISLSLL